MPAAGLLDVTMYSIDGKLAAHLFKTVQPHQNAANQLSRSITAIGHVLIKATKPVLASKC